jgi:hypothetical protein
MVWAIAEIDRQHPEYIPFAMIHDAGYWYVPTDRAEEAAANVTEIMGNLPIKETFGWDHAIPFPADAALGPDLGHMKELRP